jgi:hypothetical protein
VQHGLGALPTGLDEVIVVHGEFTDGAIEVAPRVRPGGIITADQAITEINLIGDPT